MIFLDKYHNEICTEGKVITLQVATVAHKGHALTLAFQTFSMTFSERKSGTERTKKLKKRELVFLPPRGANSRPTE